MKRNFLHKTGKQPIKFVVDTTINKNKISITANARTNELGCEEYVTYCSELIDGIRGLYAECGYWE